MKKIILAVLSIFMITSITPLKAKEKSYLEGTGGGAAGGSFYNEELDYTFESYLFKEQFGYGFKYHGSDLKSVDFYVSYKGVDYLYNENIQKDSAYDESELAYVWLVYGYEISNTFFEIDKMEEAKILDLKYLEMQKEIDDKYGDLGPNDPLSEDKRKEQEDLMNLIKAESKEFYKDLSLKLIFTNNDNEQAVVEWGFHWDDFGALNSEEGIISLNYTISEEENITSLINVLEERVNYSQVFIKDKNLYTTDSYTVFEKSYNDAVSLLEQAERRSLVTEEELKKAIDNLDTGIAALVKKDEENPVEDNKDDDGKKEKDDTEENKGENQTESNKKTPNTSIENNGMMYISILIISFATFLVVMKKREKSY